MNKKLAATILLATTLVGTATALDITPGEKNSITSNTNGFQSATSNLSLQLTDNTTGVYATAPNQYPPTTGQITLKYNNTTQTKKVKIISLSNWTVEKTNSETNVSVGNSGQLIKYNITQEGNIDENISVTSTGNISKYLVYDPNIVARKGIEKQLSIDYQIPSDTSFGSYNGTINFTGNSYSSNFTIQTTFKDGIKPEIQNISTPDFMATENPEFSVTATDNLNIKSVTANISKLNQSSGNYLNFQDSIIFNKKENTDKWLHTLTDTDEKGSYKIDFKVVDEAGNQIKSNSTYTISRLNVTQVTNSNFRFDDVWPESEVTKKIFSNTQEVDTQVELVSSDTPEEAEVSFNILYPGDSQPTPIEEGESLTVDEEGQYSLVVETDDYRFNRTKEYSGTLNISVPAQHIDVPQIVFGGDLRTDSDPKPRNLSIGQFRGRLTYLDSANASQIANLFSNIKESENGLAVYIGAVNRENCQGTTRWSDAGCTGLSIGELEDQSNQTEEWRKEVEQVRNSKFWHWIFLGLTSIIVVGGTFVNHAVKDYQRKNVFYPVWRTRKQKK